MIEERDEKGRIVRATGREQGSKNKRPNIWTVLPPATVGALYTKIFKAAMDGDMTAKYDQSSAGDITVVLSGDSFRTRLERGGALVMDHTMLGFESSAATTITGLTASRNYMLSTSSPSFRDLYVGVKTITPLVYGAGDNPVSGSILVTGAASIANAPTLTRCAGASSG